MINKNTTPVRLRGTGSDQEGQNLVPASQQPCLATVETDELSAQMAKG